MKGEVITRNGKRVASPEYRSWQMMKNRCLNKCARDWKYYGGRGIGIDSKWLSFDAFLMDMGRKPTLRHTLERVDGSGDYGKSNCVWATRQQQSRNREYAKLSIFDARLIRELYATRNYYQRHLAEMFGVSQRTICLITRGEGWREEGEPL